MEGTKFKRLVGTILAGIGLILLLFACFSFLSSDGTLMGLDVSGARKIAPTVLGLILMIAGIGMINRT